MSYIVLFFLIIVGDVLGAPIFEESLQFRFVECISGENETLSKHILQITNFNDTCIKVNKTSPQGNEVYFYIAPQTENGVQLHITTENCSTPLPKLHLSLCDHTEPPVENSTETMVTFEFSKITNNDTFDDDYYNNNTSTMETLIYTGSTVYETLHNLNLDIEEEKNKITDAPSTAFQQTTEQSSESSEEKTD